MGHEAYRPDYKRAVLDAISRGDLAGARQLLRTVPAGQPPPEAVDLRPLAEAPLLSEVSREELIALVGELELRVVQPGERILQEGEPGTSLFAIAYGAVEVVRAVPGELRSVLARLGPGDFFGEMALVANVPRLASVDAVEPTGLIELTMERVKSLAKAHPRMVEVLLVFYKERLLENLVGVSAVMRALEPDKRRLAVERFGIRIVGAGETLVRQGEAGTGFHVVLRGSLAVEGTAEDGTPIRYPDLVEGDVFGEISLVHETDATATVHTIDRCVVMSMPADAFDELVLSSPKARDAVLALVDERLGRMFHLSHGTRDALRAKVI